MKTCPKCSNTFENTTSFCPHDGEVLQESPSDMVGQVLDAQYEVEAFIAQGGMGAVYRARHILLGDRVVIKTLRSEMRQNAEWLRRFQREGRAARRFRHPNAVTVYDLRTAPDGLIYMVMEYVEGCTLDKELKARGRFSPAESLRMLEPVADVLDAAHATGVVHRDLKPENIMLGNSEDGRTPIVKLLDLGIAKMLGVGDAHAGEATSLTVAGQLLGTPYYMSPEQWGEMPRDGGAEVDGRTDIYSLGLIFYEMVAGRKPFEAKSLSDLRHKHVSAPVPPLHTFLTDVPEAFSRAVGRALAKDRNDRPATAGELTNELRAALSMPLAPRRAVDINAHAIHATDAPHASAQRSDTSTNAGRESRTSSQQSGATLDGTAVWPEVTGDALPTQTGEIITQPSGAASEQTRDRQPDMTMPLPPTPQRPDAGAHPTPPPPTANAFDTIAIEPPPSTVEKVAVQTAGVSAASNVPVARMPPAASVAPAVAPAPVRRSSLPFILGGALVVLLLLGVAAGLFVWKSMQETTPDSGAVETTSVNAPTDATATNTADNTSAPTPVEAMRYWIIAYPKEKGDGVRMAEEPLALVSDQQFQLHFMPSQRGYLYLIAQEDDGPMMTVLTSKPAQLKSNEIAGKSVLIFPPGENVLALDKNTGTETLTVIFSPQELKWPTALMAEVGHQLTPKEQEEMDEFSSRYNEITKPTTSIKDAGSASPYVLVSRVSEDTEFQPLVFKIRIEHR